MKSLDPTVAARIREACDRFKTAWQTETPPHIEDYLEGWTGAARAALLRERFHHRDGGIPAVTGETGAAADAKRHGCHGRMVALRPPSVKWI